MKAMVYKRYGPPDVLEFVDMPKPTPKDNEVLIAVQAAATNPADWHMMRAAPFFARFETGLLKPKSPVLGQDMAGRVEAVGSGVTRFKPGDEVFGSPDLAGGGFAEYAVLSEDHVVHKPENVSFAGAASVLMVGFTAIQGLRDTGHIKAGESVLINGASGGIGTFAVQYAKSVGATVTGVCSGRNAELVRSLGANHVIDYTKGDFTRGGGQYDLVFDTVGNLTAAGIARILKADGRCVVAGFTTLPHLLIQNVLLAKWHTRGTNKRIGMMPTAHVTQEDLQLLKELLETERVKPVIEAEYPLAKTADAIRHLETGRVRGKVVVTPA